ncbi:hypothetical protein [Streptomyces sp. UNOC14_S4]|uniref:hypothetical protein n=1 Tax=Streptomyces sp. UNOC14_S4 TaxID=2872340 RepID=UPI001E4E0E00|nr:hypothetical protein [Streptomyces sp. UNOC14_S4]MCC3766014.1 hypothetical protein [Streptomyces sp. UNOC14_S4]
MSEHIISTGQFPTVGKSMAGTPAAFVQPQAGIRIPKTGNAKGGKPYPEHATGHRSAKVDRTGIGGIKAYRAVQNTPIAEETGRSVHTIPSKFHFDTSGK